MKNIDEIRARYIKEPLERRLGHLASDLARVSGFLDNPKNSKAVQDILEESEFFIEWTAADAPLHIQEMLSEMQVALAQWHYRVARGMPVRFLDLQSRARTWSEQLLSASGLSTT